MWCSLLIVCEIGFRLILTETYTAICHILWLQIDTLYVDPSNKVPHSLLTVSYGVCGVLQ